mgnify:CR=1 FL=1
MVRQYPGATLAGRDAGREFLAVRVDQAGLPLPSFIDPARVIVTPPPVAGEALPQAGEIAGEVFQGSLAAGDGFVSSNARGSLRCSFGFIAPTPMSLWAISLPRSSAIDTTTVYSQGSPSAGCRMLPSMRSGVSAGAWGSSTRASARR